VKPFGASPVDPSAGIDARGQGSAMDPSIADRERAAPAGRPADAKARTQARILGAAGELFAARGYEGASISAIAARAGVSRSAIFWHFGDKETLFRETFRRLLVPFVEELANTLQTADPEKRLVELFAVYERFVDEQRPAIEAIVRWAIESPSLRASLRQPLFGLHDHFVRDVAESLLARVEEPEEAEALAYGIVSMLHGNLLLAMLDPDPGKQHRRRAGLRRVVSRALAPDAPVGPRSR
jgi:AcrR family transcriptional regulator